MPHLVAKCATEKSAFLIIFLVYFLAPLKINAYLCHVIKNKQPLERAATYKRRKIMTTSAYKNFWVEFTAEQGKVVKKDIEAINGRKGYNDSAFGNGKYYKHFASKEAAVAFLENFNQPLQKKYSCKLLTDKQFGTINISRAGGKATWDVPFTEKQNNEIYYI